MSDDWMSLAKAIARLAKAKSVEPHSAIIPIAKLAEFGVIASRIGTIADGQTGQHRRNVAMKREDWENIFQLRNDDWYKYGRATFDGDVDWLGIEVSRLDLDTYLNSLEDKTEGWSNTSGFAGDADAKPARKKPGPAPDPNWDAAIAHVTQTCLSKGYTRPLKWGQKERIIQWLTDFMADIPEVQEKRDGGYSTSAARVHSAKVIEQIPQR